jgi:bicarbonate transport system ATP-binding protein
MTNGPAASIGEDMHVPFSRPRNRARIMEDPKYYELRNFALEFLFSRYAHHEEDEATDSETEAVALPMPLPASRKKSAVAETANRPIAPAPFVRHAAVAPEASPINRGILSVSWLVAMAILAAVNMSAISSQLKQAKLGETAPQATTAGVVSSPPGPQIAASSIAPNASPAPIAAASPAPIAAASPAPIAAANSATAPNAATSATSKISDQAELDAIGQKLYSQIDQNWRTTPTFTESLTYRVKVKQNGDIMQFEPTNKVAQDFLKETPLPVLQTPAGSPAGAEKTAEFQVTFSPSNGGKLEVKTGK